jgi:flavin reductase (DIM6/NTAB) family NADH-FMN oxidoreductase RutF
MMKKSIGARTVGYPFPAYLIGTYDQNGVPNVMTAAWSGICCSKPPCIYASVTKARYTYQNLKHTNAFTVNIPGESHVKIVDYAGIYSGKDGNKFEALGLKAVKSDIVNAPYIDEFPVILECVVIKEVEIGSHVQFIGEIKDVKADVNVLDSDEKMTEIEKVQPFMYTPDRHYYSIGKRLARAFDVGRELKGN